MTVARRHPTNDAIDQIEAAVDALGRTLDALRISVSSLRETTQEDSDDDE